jgi:hypothetical protein
MRLSKPTSSLVIVARRKIPATAGKRTSVVQLVAYTDRSILLLHILVLLVQQNLIGLGLKTYHDGEAHLFSSSQTLRERAIEHCIYPLKNWFVRI